MRELDEVFAALARSDFRRRFRLGSRDADYLRARGREIVLSHARRFVMERLAPAQPFRDGEQTPMRGHPVFIAQHATGTCCRTCLTKWHAIPAGRALTEAEQEHVVQALARWLDAQDAMRDAQPGLSFQ
ncbi:MAG: DUF4186 domain-containing protein [Azospirillum brasilense]|nr:MAG: DUF4186 domain-containing protein [Azospirillum brasilense]